MWMIDLSSFQITIFIIAFVLNHIRLVGAGVKVSQASPLHIAEALEVDGWQMAAGKSANSPPSRGAYCGALIILFDSSACNSGPSTDHAQEKSSCRAVQQQAVRAVAKVNAEHGKKFKGVLMLGVIDIATQSKDGKTKSGLGNEFALALGIAEELKGDGAPRLLFFYREAGGEEQISQVASDSVPSMGALLDNTDSSRQRIFSRLFQQMRKFEIERIVPKALGSPSDIFKEAIMTVANMKCHLEEWTDSQIATIELVRSVSSISKGQAAKLIEQGAQLAPYDINRGTTTAEMYAADGQCEELKQLFDLGLSASASLLQYAIRESIYAKRSACLDTILNVGAEINTVFKGKTALMVALDTWDDDPESARKMVTVVRKLLKRGADPHILDSAGRSAHQMACKSHNYELLRLLLTEYPPPLPRASNENGKSFVLAADSNGQTMLHFAVGHLKHIVSVTKAGLRSLLDEWHHVFGWKNGCISDLNNVFRQKTDAGKRYLPKAAVSNALAKCRFNAVMVNLVLDFVRSAASNVAPQCLADSAQCRQASADAEPQDWREELLEQELWRQDKQGWSPIHIAAMYDSADAIKELLSASKRASLFLRRASAGPRPDSSERLLSNNSIAFTPAQVASISGSRESLSILLAAEAAEESSSRSTSESKTTGTSIRVVTPADLAHRFEEAPPTPVQSPRNAMADTWANSSGWRQVSDETPAGKGLKSLRTYGCDARIDVRHNLSWEEFRDRYLALGRPVMITDPLAAGSVMAPFARWRRSSLIAHYGAQVVTVADVPYPHELGYESERSTIAEFVSTNFAGNSKAWKPGDVPPYVFGWDLSLSRDINGPKVDNTAFGFLHGSQWEFVSFQWYLGSTGSGAHVHFHGDAVNYIIYGQKHWFLMPPNHTIWSSKPIGQWVKEDLPGLRRDGIPVLQCVQNAGTVLFVPKFWAHGVLNVQETTGFAAELS